MSMSGTAAAQWHWVAAWVLISTNAAAGVWALTAQRVERLRVRALWALVIVAQLAAFVSAITGVVVMNRDQRPLEDFHALYGFSALIAVAILYSYRRSDFIGDRHYLLYGFGCLFIMGLGLRNLYL
jgi:hypothetical protein